jgi:probable F420-dependent oxidoreductase
MKRLGDYGVWTRFFREADKREYPEAAAEVESLGYGAIWVPGMAGGDDYLPVLEQLLTETSSIVIAAGILNIWAHDAHEVGRFCADLQNRFPDRFLLGLGVSHTSLMPGVYDKPLSAMQAYLDVLDQYEGAGPDYRCMAALGPKMVEIARARTAGVHGYNVTPQHTKLTRSTVGPDKLVAPEQAATIVPEPEAARAVGRHHLSDYLGQMDNYERNFLRLGFEASDLEDGGSDHLVDEIVYWGDAGTVAAKLSTHLDAGADHVCVQLRQKPGGAIREDWRVLAAALFG